MADTSKSFFSRNEFLIRRLHSLSGLIPVGAFLCMHLAVNASVLAGSEVFQKQVDAIHTLRGVALIVVEWVFIFIPMLFHGIVGVMIIRSGESNVHSYALQKNIRYTLQRATGMIAFVFILAHLWHMHSLGSYFGGGKFDHERATSTAAAALQVGIWVQALYAVGILASVYHLANGLWTMGITWGVWVSPAAQRRADRICAGFGVALAVVGLSALFGMARTDTSEAEAAENVRMRQRDEQKDQEIKERQRLRKTDRVAANEGEPGR